MLRFRSQNRHWIRKVRLLKPYLYLSNRNFIEIHLKIIYSNLQPFEICSASRAKENRFQIGLRRNVKSVYASLRQSAQANRITNRQTKLVLGRQKCE